MSTDHHPPEAPAEAGPGAPAPAWERDLLERLAGAALQEQRRARRWGIFFKLAFLAYLTVVIFPYLLAQDWWPRTSERHTALVEVEGLIAAGAGASADRVITGLRAAFEDESTAGVIVRINSPGGSAVQSGYINDEIRRLRAQHPQIPLYAVVTDICASGGYYVAVAADKIYADKASVVGSIGVLMNGFGFVETLERLGVERRLLTAGEHKGLFDPFSPVKPDERAHLQGLLDELHGQFIEVVRRGRGDRLRESAELFSGLVWTGEESVRLGLVDELGSSSQVAREVFGAERIVSFTVRESWFERLAERIGVRLAAGGLSALGLSDAGGPGLR